MDPSKPSHVNNGLGHESLMEDVLVPWRDGVDGERQREAEGGREPDAADGPTAAADMNSHHRGAANKHRFNTFGYQRRTKQKVVTNFATVTKGASAAAKPRAALRQVLFSQGVSEKNQPPEERGQLDVLKQDLGTYAVPVSLRWMWKVESQGTTLEKNWTEIVDSHSTMSKMQRHQQEALWEFVHTELTYINKLIIIRDLVIAALLNLRHSGFLLEVTPELLFSNLPSILSAHQLFWQEVIYPMLHEVRRTGMPFDPMRLEAGCLQFHQRFSSYKHYCWEEENNLEFTRRQMESNLHFLTFVQWVETHPQCERMRLGDMQAKPHQRITKYPLLLKAMLKTSQDPRVQQTLRGMLSGVNSFLESINDYLRLKDEELALSISAQRVEGYEVEGINEEIDRHVREICRFDLTCPVRGAGPDVVRKLLLEENLKIRGRKDSKLEVVALLFSDVLLMTKFQKKGERLKVIRPPLALDRTYCIPLKDGYSFVLVEVGELQTALNVYIFAASTSESCSTWVDTIYQAKKTLRSWRENESNRQLHHWRIQQPEVKPFPEAKTDDTDAEEQPAAQSGREAFVDEEFEIQQSVNGTLTSTEAEECYQPPDGAATYDSDVPSCPSQPRDGSHKSVRKNVTALQRAPKGYEWIEMGVRRQQIGIHAEEAERMSWNQRVQAAPNPDHFPRSAAADPLRYTAAPHVLLLGGYPDVDYPMDEDSSSQSSLRPVMSREEREEAESLPGDGEMPTSRDSDSQSLEEDSYSQAGDEGTSSEAWAFTKTLKSPALRRRRPVTSHPAPPAQTPASLSNSNLKRNTFPPGQRSDSHRVLKLSSLKQNQGMFWNVHDRVSPDPQTLSEPELNFYQKRPKVRSHSRASIPDIVIGGEREVRLHSRSLQTLPRENDARLSPRNPNGHHSPLEGLLERSRERDGLKRDRNVKMAPFRSRYPPPSPSFSSDGDRDTEEEVEVMRHRAPTVSEGWKEQLVDGEADGRRDSVVFADGVNVDWSGWCFDDDEVTDQMGPELLQGISQSLSFWHLQGLSEQDDGQCSQV